MKKFYPVCLLLFLCGICSYGLSSCSNDDESVSSAEPLNNTLAYGDAQSKIESVVYTVDDQKVYTFYFSPTKGIVDLEAMILADDYLKIVTKTPSGPIDLLASGNQLRYKDLEVSAATADEVSNATLSLQLTSLFTAKMSLEVKTRTGQTLRAEFHEVCTRLSQDDEEQGDYDITLTKKIFSYYRGVEKDAGTDSYYIAMTNADYISMGTQFQLNEEGYVLLLSYYGTPGDDWKKMPTGSFFESDKLSDHTYFNDYSFVYYVDADKKAKVYQLLDPVKIEKDDAGLFTVTATFLDDNRKERTIGYVGELKLADATTGNMLPQIAQDVVFEGVYGAGIYAGDINENGTGVVEITLYDWKGENNEPNGSAMKITLAGKKFDNPAAKRGLTPGTYTASKGGEFMTWAPAEEMYMPLFGIVYPTGTYYAYDDGTQSGLYSYAESGTITVTEAVNHIYTIEFDLVSQDGYSIRGTFTGDVYLDNQSHDEKNDGSTTLETDYEMDLEYITRATLDPRQTIVVPSLSGEITLEECYKHSPGEFGYQYLQLGTITYEEDPEYPVKGKLKESDLVTIELVVEKGQERTLVPGIYQVTPNRFPIRFVPGSCIRGYIGGAPIDGTCWKGVRSAIGWGYPTGYYDPDYMVAGGWLNIPTINEYAAIYSGSILVAKADGGDNRFTFQINGEDVLGHTVSGTWTGPVYLTGSGEPVLPGGENPQSQKQQAVRKGALGMIRTGAELREMGATPRASTMYRMKNE